MSNENASQSVLDELQGGAESDSSALGILDEGAENSGNTPSLEEQVAKLAKAVEGQQNLMGKWGNEIGGVRQLAEQLQGQTSPQPEMGSGGDGAQNATWNSLIEDPDKTMEQKFLEFQQKQQAQANQQAQQTRQSILQMAPDFDQYQDKIVDALAADSGADKRDLLNALPTLGLPALYNAYKRVQEKERADKAEQLLTQLKQSGGPAWDQVKALAKSPQSGDSFNPPASADVPSVNPRDLSSEDLAKMMAQRGIKRT